LGERRRESEVKREEKREKEREREGERDREERTEVSNDDGISYIWWSYVTMLNNGYWPYPFQNDFTLLTHVVFDSVLIFIAYLLV
jgi:hypothetical protein